MFWFYTLAVCIAGARSAAANGAAIEGDGSTVTISASEDVTFAIGGQTVSLAALAADVAATKKDVIVSKSIQY